MKVNEIQIGDWVDFHHYYETEKKIMTRHRVTEVFECGLVGISNHPYPVRADHIEPVKITPEILEKNGFEVHNRYQYTYKDNFCKVCVSFAPRMEIGGIDLGEPPIHVSIEGALFDIKMCASSTHELQHALKLCGIEIEIKL